MQTPGLSILLKGVTILQLPSSYLLILISKSKLLFGIAISIIVLVGASDCDSQTEYVDVVYLKNGEIRRGIIIEEIPFKQIKIKTKDGNVFVYGYDEIERKTKEERLHGRPRYQPTPGHYNRKSQVASLALSAIPPEIIAGIAAAKVSKKKKCTNSYPCFSPSNSFAGRKKLIP